MIGGGDDPGHRAAATDRRGPVLVDTLDRGIGLLCRVVVVVSGSVLTAVMTANVVARYVLRSGGFRWAQELPTLLFPWLIVAGIALAAQGGAHMSVEWLYDRLAPRGKARLFVFVQLCAALSFLVLGYQAVVVAEIAGAEHSPILGLPNSIGYYALAFGAVLVALVLSIAASRVARSGWSSRPSTDSKELPL